MHRMGAPRHDGRVAWLVSYNGAFFRGSQYQPGFPTVQGTLQEVLSGICRTPVTVEFAGRTDAGVHAVGMPVATTRIVPVPPEPLTSIVNRRLHPRISLWAWGVPTEGFSPRHDAIMRRYVYVLRFGGPPSHLLDLYTWHIPLEEGGPGKLDLEAGRVFLEACEGEHDFTFFCTRPSQAVRLKRDVRRIRIFSRGEGGILTVALLFEARAFLRGMVRNMTGAFKAVVCGEVEAGEMVSALAGRRRIEPPPPAPACGLHLLGVDYPPSTFEVPFRPAPGWTGAVHEPLAVLSEALPALEKILDRAVRA